MGTTGIVLNLDDARGNRFIIICLKTNIFGSKNKQAAKEHVMKARSLDHMV